ncbi:hypothetical protein RF11_06620 [Thelohanellus kitauei]|uniref:Uncharacterized protein n=1 Tax=Thelohanellus kitauei TaxID=669202 RepID=A0A0C2IBC4_THEKT|nr:hypothetical protein RF11_06620 [Thelohanellus kitauei]
MHCNAYALSRLPSSPDVEFDRVEEFKDTDTICKISCLNQQICRSNRQNKKSASRWFLTEGTFKRSANWHIYQHTPSTATTSSYKTKDTAKNYHVVVRGGNDISPGWIQASISEVVSDEPVLVKVESSDRMLKKHFDQLRHRCLIEEDTNFPLYLPVWNPPVTQQAIENPKEN